MSVCNVSQRKRFRIEVVSIVSIVSGKQFDMESWIFLFVSFVALGPVDDCDNVGNLFDTDDL